MTTGREETLTALHTAATAIQECDSVEAACERTVTAAEDILEFGRSSLLLHEDGWLEPVALSEETPEDGVRRMAADEGLAGKTFQTGRSYVVADVEADDTSEPAKGSYLSGISVPVGEFGVFQAVAERRAAFDDADIELAELLVAHTARTIDRLRFERELERKNERLEAFLSTVSHDLRNPLNVASGRLALAQSACDCGHLDDVAAAHDRMESLIEDLLTLAREGRPVEETEPVDLGALTRRCWRTVQTDGARLAVDDEPTVEADRDRLRRLVENLLGNASEHGGDDVLVTVGSLEDGEGFYVADDGPGIPPDRREEVLDRGVSTAHEGTGFGLAIVEEIATAHDWTVSVTESRFGGARVEIRSGHHGDTTA